MLGFRVGLFSCVAVAVAALSGLLATALGRPSWEQTPLMRQAWEEIHREDDAMPGKDQATAEQRNRYYNEVKRKYGARYASDEVASFYSGACEPFDQREGVDKNASCEEAKAMFQLYYALGLKGDYDAQIEVSYCFAEGIRTCSKVVRGNNALSCAWLAVAIMSGSEYVRSDDVFGYQVECAKLRRYWEADAFALFSRIYHRPMPVSSLPAPY